MMYHSSIQAANGLNPSWVAELRKAWDAVEVSENKKGDIDGDGTITSADEVSQLNCIYLGQNCNVSNSDMNCNGQLTGADAVGELNVVYLGSFDGKPGGKPDGCHDP